MVALRVLTPNHCIGLLPNSFATAATAATCAFCCAIDSANSLALPGLPICAVAVIFCTIVGSPATDLISAAILVRASSDNSRVENSPTSPSKSSEG